MQVPVIETPWQGEFPDIANWSENYCLAGFDPQCGVGFWLHIGRWRHDLSMWREIVIVRLPDGSVIAHRAIGNARAHEMGPGGPNYAIRVLESGRRLHYSFGGGVRRVPQQSMRDGLVADGPRTPMTFDWTFESDADIWDLHKVGHRQDFLPAGHIEQIGRLTGPLRVGNDTYNFNALVNRDHSLGARDNKDLHSHQWLQGYFENGVGFLLFDAMTRSNGKVVFSEAVVYEGNRLYEAKLDYGWRCDDARRDEEPIRFKLIYEKGMHEVASTAFRGNSYLCLASPNDMYVGVYASPGGATETLLEQSVSLQLNGSVPGYGCFERTVFGVIRPEY
jgi:hypothetical protein